jgi:hypothetical protein
MRMENIRTRAELGGTESKNYLTRGFKAMVKKAEENKGRTQFWANILLTVSMAFLPWLGLQLIEKGRMEVRQENYQKDIDTLKKAIADKDKEIEAMKQALPVTDDEVSPRKQRRAAPKTAKSKKPVVNGQLPRQAPVADRLLPAFSTYSIPRVLDWRSN